MFLRDNEVDSATGNRYFAQVSLILRDLVFALRIFSGIVRITYLVAEILPREEIVNGVFDYFLTIFWSF